jgi:hypothetical protein
MKVDMNKKYTSNDKPIRILCTDRNKNYTTVGLYDDGSIRYFKEDGTSFSGPKFNLIEAWEPQEGEWCWFWESENPTYAFVGRFEKMTESGKFKSSAYYHCIWKYCAKYTDKLPKHLKEK